VVLNDRRALYNEMRFLIMTRDRVPRNNLRREVADALLAFLLTRTICDAMVNVFRPDGHFPPELQNRVYNYVLAAPRDRPVNVVGSRAGMLSVLSGGVMHRSGSD
jgi:hypothetical protein